jgi:uncharacterized protein YkwD
MVAGLACAAVVATLAVVVGHRQVPAPATALAPGPLPVAGPLVIGPPPSDPLRQPTLPTPPLLLPVEPTPPAVPPLPALPAPIAPPPPVAAARPAPPQPAIPRLGGPVGQILAITNARRLAAGCRPLKVDARLMRAAQRHTEDMAERGYFAHDTPDGTSFGEREVAAGYSPDKTGGENIARGQATAASVMRDWMGSAPHRRNILDCEFTRIGIGYVAAGHYWTQDFGY